MDQAEQLAASDGTIQISTPKGLGLLGSWPALIVDQTTKDQLRWNAQGRIDTHDLPIIMVHLSSLTQDNILAVAILSWRWDTSPSEISSNLLSALILAKHEYISYLFIDTISIDQTLPKDKLIEQVAAFSTLYSKLPVIVAYDKHDDGAFQRVFYRPWLLAELHAIRENPYPITYVGHMMMKGAYWAYGFTYHFERIWKHSFMATIIAILMGDMHMTGIADFRFILHPFADALQAAYAQMGAKDYLLTVVLLYIPFMPDVAEVKENIQQLEYQRYGFRLCEDGDVTSFPEIAERWPQYDVYLDGTRVGNWGVSTKLPRTELHVPSREYEDQPKTMRLFEGAVPFILQRLGLGEGDWKTYLQHVGSGQMKRVVQRESKGRTQVCGTVEVELKSECVLKKSVTRVVTTF